MTSDNLLNAPPYDRQLERGILGAILNDNELVAEVGSMVKPSDFYISQHALIYETMLALDTEQAPISVTSIFSKMGKEAQKEGYASLLVDCSTNAFFSGQVDYYMKKLLDLSARRQAITTFKQGIDEASSDVPTEELIANAENRLGNIGSTEALQSSSIKTEIVDTWEYYLDVLNGKTDQLWIKTGLKDIDDIIVLAPATHIVIGARPRMGKTALALCMAVNISGQGRRSLYFSTEMSKRRLMQRLISQVARVDHSHHIAGRLTPEEEKRVSDTAHIWSNLNIGILDGRWDVDGIRRRSIQEKKKQGVDCIFVDLINKLQRPTGISINSKEHLIVNENSKRLAELSIELDLPVVTLQHLNRDVDRRNNQRPVLGDLREAGEEYADIVMFPFLEEKVNPMTEMKGIALIEVAKNRDGEEGEAQLLWIGKHMLFLDLAKKAQIQSQPPVKTNGGKWFEKGQML